MMELMQSIIGSYASFEQAGAAVRCLERHLSIQDIVVADSSHTSWRLLDQSKQQKPNAPSFLVVMTGTMGAIEQARELLALIPSTAYSSRIDA
jgi:hypothetical protein